MAPPAPRIQPWFLIVRWSTASMSVSNTQRTYVVWQIGTNPLSQCCRLSVKKDQTKEIMAQREKKVDKTTLEKK